MKIMKKLFALFVLGIFAVGMSSLGFAQAAETQNATGENILGASAGALPDSPFYGLKKFGEGIRMFFTFDSLEKAKLKYSFAQLRLIEADAMARRNKTQLAENALNEYEDDLNETAGFEEKLSAAGRNTSELADLAGNSTYIHILVLQEVYDKVPDSAKPAIKDAIENALERQGQISQGVLDTGLVNITISVDNQTITWQVPSRFAERFLEKASELHNSFLRQVVIENEAELKSDVAEITGINREKALQQINDASDQIIRTAERLALMNITNTTANSLLQNAEEHFNMSQAAFSDGRYGEAFGQAISAESIAEDAERFAEEKLASGEGGNENENRACAQVITPAVKNGECREFPTPCDVPEGWNKVDRCESSDKKEGIAKCCMIAKGICKSNYMACIPESIVDCNSIICNPRVL